MILDVAKKGILRSQWQADDSYHLGMDETGGIKPMTKLVIFSIGKQNCGQNIVNNLSLENEVYPESSWD